MNKLLRTLTVMLGALTMLCTLPGTALADDKKVRVLTQNLYVGSDLFQLVQGTGAVPELSVPEIAEKIKTLDLGSWTLDSKTFDVPSNSGYKVRLSKRFINLAHSS